MLGYDAENKAILL